MKFSHVTAIAAAAIALAAPAAHAAPDYITGYIGYFDVTQGDNSATQFGVEYRAKPFEYGIRPTIGINADTDGSAYGYVGFNWDIALIDKQLYLIPNFMAGGYHRGDEGKRLGGAIEFRSGIELAYQMQNEHRLGIAFNHISNASIYNHNPGAETVLVNYSVPVGSLLAR